MKKSCLSVRPQNGGQPTSHTRLRRTRMKIFVGILFVAAALLEQAQGVDFAAPASIASSDGVLDTSLTLQVETVRIPGTNLALRTRLLNGTLPGPTLRLQPGDLLRVYYTNALTEQPGTSYRHNRVSAPDETNLHFHGLHISGILPSDDAKLVLTPGESYQYETQLPDNHMPGTHWMHPHRHGSSALQVGGGAVGVVIVEDNPNDLPTAVAQATKIVLLVHLLDLEALQELADESVDQQLQVSLDDNPNEGEENMGRNARLLLVNGQYQPIINGISAGTWMRFRIVWSSWRRGTLDWRMPGCEMVLLAKDGIYIPNFPRPINGAPVVPGGRADVLVQCPEPNTRYDILGPSNAVLATVVTTDQVVTPSALSSWSPNYPDYLTDLTNTPATEGCACSTTLDRRTINGELYDEDVYLHETFVGAVVERTLRLDDHPYHQHVYPLMLAGGFRDNSGYNKVGDWMDSIEGRGTIRYKVTSYEGTVMVHCHRLQHEDEGMMTSELVHPETNGTCTCNSAASPWESAGATVALGWTGVVSPVLLFWLG